MGLVGSLEEFSLTELFRLIELGQKSGLLSIQTLPHAHAPEAKSSYYYIWFWQGQLVAIANRLDQKNLIHLIEQQQCLSQSTIEQLWSLCPDKIPLGHHFKRNGVLTLPQVKMLFRVQLRQVSRLFELSTGHFEMRRQAVLPWREMTGLRMGSVKVAFLALRRLHNWQGLSEQIPSDTSALQPIRLMPHLQLQPLELQVWEFANGATPLGAIALQLNQPVVKVQQAAFRLIVAGLVEENITFSNVCPSKFQSPKLQSALSPQNPVEVSFADRADIPSTMNPSFLKTLIDFLRNKVFPIYKASTSEALPLHTQLMSSPTLPKRHS